MIPDIRYLHYAEAVARLGSFRRAAHELGVDQSTVSRRLRAVEDRVGILLFERTRIGTRLTKPGAQFLADASQAVSQLQRAVERLDKKRSNLVRIGVVNSLASGVLRSTLRHFIHTHPKAELTIRVGSVEEHFSQLAKGEIDLAFLPHRTQVEGLSMLPLWREHAVVALPTHHPLVSKQDLEWSDLLGYKFIFARTGPDDHFKNWFIGRLDQSGLTVEVEEHEVGREDLISMVGMGFGLTVLCSSITGAQYPDVVFHPINDEQGEILWSATWPARSRNRLAPKLIGSVRSAFGPLPVGSP